MYHIIGLSSVKSPDALIGRCVIIMRSDTIPRVPKWWNRKTLRIQAPVSRKARAGSIPAFGTTRNARAGVVELGDTLVLGTSGLESPCRFKSCLRHQVQQPKWWNWETRWV